MLWSRSCSLERRSGAVRDVTGVAPHVNPMHTESDIRVPMVQWGVPCVGLGSRSGNLAQEGCVDEWVEVAGFEQLVRSMVLVIERWCGTCGTAADDDGAARGRGQKRKAGQKD